MIQPLTLADRFGNSRPGFELVAIEDVALPFFRLDLEVVLLERAPMPVIDEFLMRAVLDGLSTPESVRSFLGLEIPLVEQAIVTQVNADLLDYRVSEDGQEGNLRVTPLGAKALQEATVSPKRAEIQIAFDRLLWSPSKHRLSDLVKPKRAEGLSLIDVPPKVKRRLGAADLEVASVERNMRERSRGAQHEVDLLAITNVVNFRHVLPASVLVFEAVDGSATQIAFVIDGRLSASHEQAFAAIDGPKRCGFLADGAAAEKVDGALPSDLRAKILEQDAVVDLKRKIANSGDLDLDGSTRTRAPSGPASAQGVEQQAVSAKTLLSQAPVRAIETYEHRELLDEAMAGAESRLLIVTPWVKSAVVNSNFVGVLERLCRNGVDVRIGWGFGEAEEIEKSDQPAIERLRSAAERLPRFSFEYLGDGHDKVLLWDDNLVVTSFNWLSFRGDPKLRYRREFGLLVRDKPFVQEQYDSFRSLFKSQTEV